MCAPAEQPARLHGDLGNGNVLGRRRARPADRPRRARRTPRDRPGDAASLRLSPPGRGARRLPADGAAAGRRDRIGAHQLVPLLGHAVLFGRGYAEQAVVAARAAIED